MERTLQEEIADYQQMVETTRADGRCLRQRLKQEGWEFVDSLLESDRQPCAIHPDLWADLAASENIIFDDEQDFTYFGRDLDEEEWEMVVELSVL